MVGWGEEAVWGAKLGAAGGVEGRGDGWELMAPGAGPRGRGEAVRSGGAAGGGALFVAEGVEGLDVHGSAGG